MEVISISDLFSSDHDLCVTSIDKLKEALMCNGWAFVRIDEELFNTCVTCIEKADCFFNKDAEYKNIYLLPTKLGYIPKREELNFKESIHVVTGEIIKDITLPIEIKDDIITISEAMDSLSMRLYKLFIEKIILKGVDINAIDIPLIRAESTETKPIKCRYGMLDIVKYSALNTKREYYVAAHSDPGLFSISVKSTSPGLKMYNRKVNEWVNIPPDSSILWCGLAAEEMSKGSIKSGLHAVTVNDNAPRLSMWYEVCVAEQHRTSVHTLKAGLKGGMKLYVKTLSAKKIEIDVEPTDTIERVMERIEEKEGIPPPKQRLIFGGKALNPEKFISDYRITAGSTLHLVLAL